MELLQSEVVRVNKLIKSQRAKVGYCPQQSHGGQQDQVQRVTLEDVHRFKRTFDLFKVLRLPNEDGHQHSKVVPRSAAIVRDCSALPGLQPNRG